MFLLVTESVQRRSGFLLVALVKAQEMTLRPYADFALHGANVDDWPMFQLRQG
jgi:hypothetical protein